MNYSEIIRQNKYKMVDANYKHISVDIDEVVNGYGDVVCKDIQKFLKNEIDLKKLNKKVDKLSLYGINHHRNQRNNTEYLIDIFLGWLSEDIVENALAGGKITVKKSGSDSKRKFLSGNKISGKPDLILSCNDKELALEVISNYPFRGYSSFWESCEKFDLRDNKFQRLKEHKMEIVVTGIVISEKKCFLKDITDIIALPSKAQGNKQGMEIKLPDFKRMIFDINKIEDQIINRFFTNMSCQLRI